MEPSCSEYDVGPEHGGGDGGPDAVDPVGEEGGGDVSAPGGGLGVEEAVDGPVLGGGVEGEAEDGDGVGGAVVDRLDGVVLVVPLLA
jgi:hypothetical protein